MNIKSRLKNVAILIKATIFWFFELILLWLTLILLGMILVIFFYPGSNEAMFRFYGLFLQIVGLSTVILGTHRTIRFFHYPSYISIIKAWKNRCPLVSQAVDVPIESINQSLQMKEPEVFEVNGPDTDSSIQDRIEALEKNIFSLHERITRIHNDIDMSSLNKKRALEVEANLRKTQDEEILRKIERAGTDGVYVTLAGVIFMIVGVILSTASSEIFTLLG